MQSGTRCVHLRQVGRAGRGADNHAAGRRSVHATNTATQGIVIAPPSAGRRRSCSLPSAGQSPRSLAARCRHGSVAAPRLAPDIWPVRRALRGRRDLGASRGAAGLHGTSLSRDAWRQVVQAPALIAILVVTAVSASGQFPTFAYIAPVCCAHARPSPNTLSLALVLFGLAGCDRQHLGDAAHRHCGPGDRT